MKFSFYRNLTWLIGILVAVEIYFKMGIHRGLIPMIADLVIVLILTFLFHRLRKAGVDPGANDLNTPGAKIDPQAESEWQKRHDQWWQAHQNLANDHQVTSTGVSHHSTKVAKSTSLSNQKLTGRINYLNQQINTMHSDSAQQASYRDSSWYRQIMQMKRQIAKLKSEYK